MRWLRRPWRRVRPRSNRRQEIQARNTALEHLPFRNGVKQKVCRWFFQGKTPISVNELEKNIGESKYEGKVQGKVVEVCKAMGCWAKIERADGSTVMIKVKDHEFAMPLDLIGKVVVAEGSAEVKVTSVSLLKHYAEDGGKSKEEVDKIKEPKKEVLMTVKGVKVVE